MIYEMTVPQFVKTLRNLNSMLSKAAAHAEAKKFDMSVLLNARLAPDQFNLIRQIQIATDTAKLSASRLSGKDAPMHDDKETTLAEIKTRIESVTTYLNSFTAPDFTACETKKITQPRWEGKWMTGFDFTVHHAIPNFYFHVTTAYAILRHNGVDVGKKDFLGELPFKS
jgi:hypothetical protein